MAGSSKLKDIQEFLDGVAESKLQNFAEHEYTIAKNRSIGLRLDHQGMNVDDEGYPHRIYIQPLKGGKSTWSRAHQSNEVVAQVHATENASPEELIAALVDSARQGTALCYAGTPLEETSDADNDAAPPPGVLRCLNQECQDYIHYDGKSYGTCCTRASVDLPEIHCHYCWELMTEA